jgi:stage II sporulation protein E
LHYDSREDGTITFCTLPRLRADYLHRCVAADPGGLRQSKRTVCGDTLRLFEGDDGMFYALLCDGMGNGRGAALTSGISAVFLERVLRTGVGVQTALRLLNQYLLSRRGGDGEECSSTVDLLELDLYRGRARFIKSGAAPSLILREGRLFRLTSHTVPIGILQAIDAQVIPFDIQPGDHILLMSDGVTDTTLPGDRGDDWLSDILSSAAAGGTITDESALIDSIFAQARSRGSSDDMSIISIQISEEPLT